MNETELRALVRDVIARHVRPDNESVGSPYGMDHSRPPRHASHAMFVLPAGSDSDGPCLIEPAVTCNHCGYCKSYGH
jgi:hypothetical protein